MNTTRQGDITGFDDAEVIGEYIEDECNVPDTSETEVSIEL